MKICELWYLICDVMADRYGTPLPEEILSLGDDEKGWGVKLNATGKDVGGMTAYSAHVSWGGFPAGIVGTDGGLIAAGAVANEKTCRAWLQSQKMTAVASDVRGRKEKT